MRIRRTPVKPHDIEGDLMTITAVVAHGADDLGSRAFPNRPRAG
jgi:hypothetical protein